jgi:hypothetical protein
VKNTTIRLAVALCALALAAPAAAQSQPQPQAQPQRPAVGVGVSVVPFSDAGGAMSTIEVYVPIRVAPQLRLEPSLGIFTRDRNGTGATDTRDVTLGVGVFYVKPIAGPVDMYVGGRLKLNFAHSDDGVTSNSDTDLLIAGALGGEYYLVSHFSVGLEAQLGLYQRGDVSGDDSGWFTTGLAFMRFYF